MHAQPQAQAVDDRPSAAGRLIPYHKYVVSTAAVRREIARVCAVYGVREDEIYGSEQRGRRRGDRSVTMARWDAWHALAKPGISIKSIARAFGVDRTTVAHALRVIASEGLAA